MSDCHVAIIDSGVANLAAVESALAALEVEHVITGSPDEVLDASHVVLPGVGRFSAGLDTLRRRGLDETVHDVHENGTPLLAMKSPPRRKPAGSSAVNEALN